MTNNKTQIQGVEVYLAQPMDLPSINFLGREWELKMCRAAWNVKPDGSNFIRSQSLPLNFSLQGSPGNGKNEIVYQLSRELKMPLYMIQGHEELSPEDLALTIVPAHESVQNQRIPLVLRASPLATALIKGGLFFFDEINRVPERALSPLSSVLDERKAIYSAITGMWIEPSEEAKRNFRFCCALNPAMGNDLPAYIQQRTLPIIRIDYPEFEELRDIIKLHVAPSRKLLNLFDIWYNEKNEPRLSVRQAITMMAYANKLSALEDPEDALRIAATAVLDGGGRDEEHKSALY